MSRGLGDVYKRQSINTKSKVTSNFLISSLASPKINSIRALYSLSSKYF
nr:hypothetical protein [Elizabethkingia sp. ASV34]